MSLHRAASHAWSRMDIQAGGFLELFEAPGKNQSMLA
jgi:hypothetical protein